MLSAEKAGRYVLDWDRSRFATRYPFSKAGQRNYFVFHLLLKKDNYPILDSVLEGQIHQRLSWQSRDAKKIFRPSKLRPEATRRGVSIRRHDAGCYRRRQKTRVPLPSCVRIISERHKSAWHFTFSRILTCCAGR